jgi:hypothetical protein
VVKHLSVPLQLRSLFSIALDTNPLRGERITGLEQRGFAFGAYGRGLSREAAQNTASSWSNTGTKTLTVTAAGIHGGGNGRVSHEGERPGSR